MISQKRAYRALEILVEKGLITPEQSKNYVGMIDERVSYRSLMLGELGTITGELYCREEEAQHKIIHRLHVSLADLSVTEVLVLEDELGVEPWHNERYSEAKAKGKFEQEAGEPWHVSLRDRFRPDPKIVAYFKRHPEFRKFSTAILKSAYRV